VKASRGEHSFGADCCFGVFLARLCEEDLAQDLVVNRQQQLGHGEVQTVLLHVGVQACDGRLEFDKLAPRVFA